LKDSPVHDELKNRRGIPDDIIKQFELGAYQGKIVYPIRNHEGIVQGFKVHHGPHLKADGTKATSGGGVKTQLYPASHLMNSIPPDFVPPQSDDPDISRAAISGGIDNINSTIYIVEGEPDVWRTTGEGATAVTGTAGASTWREEWKEHFKGKDVIVVYDNDKAGREGQAKVVKSLKGIAGRLRYVEWPDGLADEYDVTDWLQDGKSLDDLPLVEYKVKRTTLADVKNIVRKWLQLGPGEDELIDIVLGTVIANRFSGDPVWILVVGPPGIIKTELLRTLSGYPDTFMLSTLTASTLISGFVQKNGEDPSLLPKLDGKVLIIKDFTAVLDMPSESRQQILGDLRDAYDGEMAKAFGSEAGTRSYKAKFGLLAAVTPAIDKYHKVSQQLGERFLKVRISVGDRISRTRRAMLNSGQEGPMRTEMAQTMESALITCEVCNEEDIDIDNEVLERIIDLADCLAILRSVVARERYSGAVEYVPEPEVGTRIVKQFAKLARGIAAIRGKAQVDEAEFAVVRRIGRDTLPSKRRQFVQSVFDVFHDGYLSTQVIADNLSMPTDTAKLALEDLWLLDVVDREGKGKFTWRMRQDFRHRLDDLGFFENDSIPPEVVPPENVDSKDSTGIPLEVVPLQIEGKPISGGTTSEGIPIEKGKVLISEGAMSEGIPTEHIDASVSRGATSGDIPTEQAEMWEEEL
jgi:hypothetical protein